MMTLRHRILTIVLAIFAIAGALAPTAARAEETRALGGHNVTLAFRSEPAYRGEPNAVRMRLLDGGGRPVIGAQSSLQLEVSTPGHSQVLAFRPVRDEPGTYDAVFIPPAAGRYDFRLFGALGGTTIDERYVTGPEGFGRVLGRTSNDYSSVGAYLAYSFLGLYLIGIAAIGVYTLVRRRRQRALAARP